MDVTVNALGCYWFLFRIRLSLISLILNYCHNTIMLNNVGKTFW